MDFYFIPTLENMELSLMGDRVFCLAHFYIQYPKYKQFFLDIRKNYPGVFITLDNSAAEESLVTADILYDIVGELKPDEVISPDVLFDKEKTLANLKEFKTGMFERGFISHTKIFGCPQGKDKKDWIDCYDAMNADPDVSTIGLSKIAVPRAFTPDAGRDEMIKEARHLCIDFLNETNRFNKDLHLLGMGDPTEYAKYTPMNIPQIRSSDSCYAILGAYNGVDFEVNPEKRVVTTNDFYLETLTAEQITLSLKNIAFLKWYTNKTV